MPAELPADAAPAAGPARRPTARGSQVFPPEINLTTARDRQSIVVQATYADGITRDVTGGGHASRRPIPAWCGATGRRSTPAADGATTLAVAFGGQSVDGAGQGRAGRRRSRRSASGST